jgi:hypothetical protein
MATRKVAQASDVSLVPPAQASDVSLVPPAPAMKGKILLLVLIHWLLTLYFSEDWSMCQLS